MLNFAWALLAKPDTPSLTTSVLERPMEEYMSLRLLKNEEDTKLKIVMEYLRSLGFDDSELFYEESFYFKAGRFTFKIETGKEVASIEPRLDILIKRNEQNLCIVEVKDVDIPITAQEIDQAVTYGRLVHPIAPICIITNGKDWKMVDTISKREISKETLPNLDYVPSLPQDIYYEALQHFCGYSEENVLVFCQKQVDSYMATLKGGIDDRDKKYIPDIYESRKNAIKTLHSFLKSDSHCFVVVGDSGSGKTCWICHSALGSLKQGYATFFYRGNNVEQGIFQAISDDLNWNFSPQYDAIQGVKRLLELFKDKNILVIIDELDGMPQSVARRVIDDFLQRVVGTHVKLIATCKSENWKTLLEDDGVPTLLAGKIFQTGGDKGYQLEDFDPQEFYSMLEKYRLFYQYDGLFEMDAYEACKQNPFLLRIMFEVASEKQQSYISYTTIDFYRAYYDKLGRRFGTDKDKIERMLVHIAQCFYNHNMDELDREVIFNDLDLPLTEALPARLFELHVLEQLERDDTTYISFYFKKLRDYLIAFRALKWPNLSSQDFSQAVDKAEIRGVHLEVLNLYYPLASAEHKRALDGGVYENAKQFVMLYEQLIRENFSAFKSAFPPNTTGLIGLAGFIDLSEQAITYRGFRPLKEPDDLVMLFPRSRQRMGRDIGNLAVLHNSGLQKWTSSANGFRGEVNIAKEVIWYELWPTLEESIKNGMLDESQDKNLLIERVLAITLSHYKDFFQSAHQASRESYFPLRLDQLREYILYKIAHYVLANRSMDAREGFYRIEDEWVGEIHSTRFHFMPAQWAEIDKQAWAYAKAGTDLSSETHFAPRYNYGAFLLRDLEDLARLGVAEINSSPLVDWYDRKQVAPPHIWNDERFSLLERFVEHLYLAYLNAYQTLVERNFPTLCQNFRLYKRMPLRCSVAIERERQDQHTRLLANSFTVLVLEHKEVGGSSNNVTLSSPAEINEETDKLRADPNHGGLTVTQHSGHSLLQGQRSYVPLEGIDKNLCLLRNLVYSRIKDELEPAFLKFAAKHGAPPGDLRRQRILQRLEDDI